MNEALEGTDIDRPKPAFYALDPGGLRDFVTLLHLPYTLLHLSFVVIGAALAPLVRLDRLGAALVAFFLAVGIAAHFLDELNGRPLRTHISARILVGGASLALVGACAIGLLGLLHVSFLLLGFIISGAFMVLAYNLELWGGRFHSDVTFALFWGAFPALTASWVMDESLSASGMLGATFCYAVARIQRTLSTPARMLRRRLVEVTGTLAYSDGSTVPLGRADLLVAPERALGWLCAALPVLAVSHLALRLRP
jgi:hypothetical protein